MKKDGSLLSIILLHLIISIPCLKAQNAAWTQQIYGGNGGVNRSSGRVLSTATDKLNNIYTLGSYNAPFSIGDTILYYYPEHWSGNMYLTKHNPEGKLQWVKSFGANISFNYTNNKNELFVDHNNNVLFIGKIKGKPDNYELLSGDYKLSFSETEKLFTIKMDSKGKIIWGKPGIGKYMAFDNKNNFYTKPKNGVLGKFDPDGTLQWKKSIETFDSLTKIRAITTDKQGGIYLSGIPDYQFEKIFLQKLDLQGNNIWINKISTNYRFSRNDLRLKNDQAGNLYLMAANQKDYTDNKHLIK